MTFPAQWRAQRGAFYARSAVSIKDMPCCAHARFGRNQADNLGSKLALSCGMRSVFEQFCELQIAQIGRMCSNIALTVFGW